MDNFNNFEDEVFISKVQDSISVLIKESETHKQNSMLLMMVAEYWNCLTKSELTRHKIFTLQDSIANYIYRYEESLRTLKCIYRALELRGKKLDAKKFADELDKLYSKLNNAYSKMMQEYTELKSDLVDELME